MTPHMVASIGADLAHIERRAHLLQEALVAPVRIDDASAGASRSTFADTLEWAVRRVDEKDRAAADRMAAVETGQSDDLVGAMLASQEAGLSFSLLLQVRNKLAGALDELVKLPL